MYFHICARDSSRKQILTDADLRFAEFVILSQWDVLGDNEDQIL